MRASTTTVERLTSVSSTSRASGACDPIATTQAWSATSVPSKSGSRAVVQQQMTSAADDELFGRAVAADDVHVLDRADRPHGLGVRAPLRAAAEHEQAAGVRGREAAHGDGGDGGRPEVGERDAVEHRDGRERRGVEHHAHALHARLARADGDELDRGVPADRGRHDQQLSLPHRDARAWGRRLRVEATRERGLERVGGLDHRHARDVGERQRHRSTNPMPSGSSGSSVKRCSPVR